MNAHTPSPLRLAASGAPICRLVERWPLKHNTITAAVTGRTWAHLPGAVTALAKAKAPGSKPGQAPGAILSESDVRKIKHDLTEGAKGAHLAARFGVSAATISAIKKGRNWSHV